MTINLAHKLQYFKLLYLKGLLENHLKPLDAVNAGYFVRNEKKEQLVIDADGLALFEKHAVNPASSYNVKGVEYVALAGTPYTVQTRPIKSLLAADKNNELHVAGITNEELKVLEKMPACDLIVMASVMGYVEAQMINLFNQFEPTAEEDPDGLKFTKFVEEQRDIRKKLKEHALEYYVRPQIRAFQLHENQEVRKGEVSITSHDQIHNALAVLSACESALSNGNVPEAYQERVYQLAEETANSLAGKFDAKKYNNIITSLPLERSWSRIIVGAACVFAGLMLAAAAVTLAVHSFGVSTPLSVLGVAAGVDLVIAGLAIAGATVSLTMAGTGAFFAGSKHAESEIAEGAKDFNKKMGG